MKKMIPFFIVAMITVLILIGCNGTVEEQTGLSLNKDPLLPSTIKMTKPWDPLDTDDPAGREPMRVVHTLWHEPEEDPRIVIGYQLEDGTPYFDHIVLMFGLMLRYGNTPSRNCSCNRYELHACYLSNNPMNTYINDWEKYFKPIQDRGIKVLFSITPYLGGAAVGNLFESASWTGVLQDKYGDYPFNQQETFRMIDEVARFMKDFKIDGIAFYEEPINAWLPPDGGTGIALSRNNGNIIRFMYELQAALNILGENRKIIYENIECVSIPEYATFVNRRGETVTVYRNEILNYTFNPWYGRFDSDPSSPDFPVGRYGPVSIDIAGSRDLSPRPNYGNTQSLLKKHLYGNYGGVMYYHLRSGTDIAEGERSGRPAWPANRFGVDNKVETYLTKISEALHGQKTVFIGNDYRR